MIDDVGLRWFGEFMNRICLSLFLLCGFWGCGDKDYPDQNSYEKNEPSTDSNKSEPAILEDTNNSVTRINLDDPVMRNEIISIAEEVQLEIKPDGSRVLYKPLSRSPYKGTGWVVTYFDDGVTIKSLCEVNNGELDGLVSEWRKNGQKQIETNWKGGKQDGVATSWFESGEKKSEGNWKDGKQHGLWTWYAKGQKKHEVNFKVGKQDGVAISWFENGEKESEGNWKDGKQNGLQTTWHGNGQKKSEVNIKDAKPDGLSKSWYDNGNKKSETNWKNKKQHGLRSAWYENGQQQEESNWLEGKQDGLSKLWHENGQLQAECQLKDGKPNGLSIMWHENGQKRYEGEVILGIPTGTCREWHANGSKKSHINFENGKLSGWATKWYKNGQISGKVFFKNGLFVSGKAWKANGDPCLITNLAEGNGVSVSYDDQGNQVETFKYIDGKQYDAKGNATGLEIKDANGNIIPSSETEKRGLVLPK
jgi:antitoxin component YwqK of YwqJK toxin-antitoxin module